VVIELAFETSGFFKKFDDAQIQRKNIVSVNLVMVFSLFCVQMTVWRWKPWFVSTFSGSERSGLVLSGFTLHMQI